MDNNVKLIAEESYKTILAVFYLQRNICTYLEFIFRKRLARLGYNLYDVPNVQLKVSNKYPWQTIVITITCDSYVCQWIRQTLNNLGFVKIDTKGTKILILSNEKDEGKFCLLWCK